MSREKSHILKAAGGHRQTKKAEAFRLTGNQTLWAMKVAKGRNLMHPNVTCCSLFSHYNKISLAEKKFPP